MVDLNKKSYVIDSKRKVIVANMQRVGDKQLNLISKYIKLGYTLEEYKAPKKAEYAKENMIELLEKRPELLEIYKDVCNEPVIDKETKEPKKLKDGTIKTKGHIAGIKFYKEYIEGNEKKLDSINVEEIKKKIEAKKKIEKE